jgi:hypothetical protein
MRDDKDPGTLELTLPRKRGRPPKFGYAMSDAQRAARYRARRAGQANHADVRSCSDMVLLDKIRAAVSARHRTGRIPGPRALAALPLQLK